MEKTSYEELTESKRQNLRESMVKLKADASEMIAYTHRLRGLYNHFDNVEVGIKKRTRELDLKEKELQSLSLGLEKKIKNFEAEKSEAGDLKKFTEECNRELRSKKNQLTEKLDCLTRIHGELELKNKQLGQVMAELKRRCNDVHKVQEHKRKLEDETDKKKKELSLVVNQIEASGKQLGTVDEQLESLQKLLESRSLELVSTGMELGSMRKSIMDSSTDLKLKEKMVQSLNNLITDCGKEIDSKSEELGEVQKLIEQQTKELAVLRNQCDSSKLFIQVLSEELVAKEKIHMEILETICRSSSEMEEKAKKIKAAETEVSELNFRSKMLRQEVEGKEKELDLLKNQIESEEKKLLQRRREMKEETDRKNKDVVLILSKIEESDKQLAAGEELLGSLLKRLEVKSVELLSNVTELEFVRESIMLSSSDLGVMRNQCESARLLNQELSEELVAKEMELKCVGESSKRIIFDLEVKEKRLHALNNLITFSAKQLDSKFKELEEIQKAIELKKRLRQMSGVLVKHEKQLAAAPINDTIQQNAAETEPSIEDDLSQHGLSASLTRHEVSSVLRALPNPAEFILEEVQEHISEDLDLQDSLLEILVLFFEELAEIRRSDDPQLEPKATQVATLWKGKITMKAPKSSLEALAFLMFIVAYGLKKLINEEETVLLALSIAHFDQAPRLFNSLSINPEIQKFVKELIEKSQYISAVRLICLFKLDKEFPPCDLLMKEIINLRQSALKKRPTESSQAKDKDAERLRAILELVADYNLEINLPGDLIAKLMIQREN